MNELEEGECVLLEEMIFGSRQTLLVNLQKIPGLIWGLKRTRIFARAPSSNNIIFAQREISNSA